MQTTNHVKPWSLSWFVVLGFAFLIALSISTPSPLQSQAVEEEGEEKEEDKEEQAGPKSFDRINERLIVHGHAEKIFRKLVRIENDIEQAIAAEAAGAKGEAARLFRKARVSISVVHRDHFLISNADPMVRQQNLQPAEGVSDRTSENWIRLSEYLTRWASFLPSNEIDNWANDMEMDAARALAALSFKPSLAGYRKLLMRFHYTKAAKTGLSIALQLALESAAYYEVAAIATMFRECRPLEYQSEPFAHLALMVALYALDDRERLAEERAFAESNHKGSVFLRGDEELGFFDALKAWRQALRLQPADKPWVPNLKGMQTPLYLSTGVSGGTNGQFVTNPLFLDNGVVLPKARPASSPDASGRGAQGRPIDSDLDLHWFKELDQKRAHVLTLPPEGRGKVLASNRGRRGRRNNVQRGVVATRTYGAAASKFFGRLSSHGTPANQHILAAPMASSIGMGLPFTGARIQLFDLAQDARVLATLPIQKDGPRIVDFQEGRTIGNRKKYALSGMHFGGTPVAVGDRLYALGCYPRDGSTEFYLTAFRLSANDKEELGSLVWMKKICALSNMSRGWSRVMALVETSTISASHGRLFLQTNCGAIACCDQEEGDVLWLTAYPEVTNNTRYFGWGYPRNSYASIFPSAPGLDGAVVVAAPTNGNNAFAIDALSGRTIRALRGRGRIAYAAYKFFLGVQGGIAYFQSDNAIIAEAVSLRAQALDEADKLVSRRRLTTNEEFSAEVKGDLNQRRGIIVGDEIWLDLGEKRGLMVLNRFTLAKKHLVAWPADSVSKVLKESKVGGEDVVKNQPMIDRYGRPVNRAMLNHGIVTMRFIRSSASPLERPLVVRSNNTGAKIYVIEDSASEPNKE